MVLCSLVFSESKIDAMQGLLEIYVHGNKTVKAEEYYNLLIKEGVYDTYNELGIIYYEQENYTLAEKYYKKTIEKSDVLAMFQLAEFYKVLDGEDGGGNLTKLAEKYYLMYLEESKKINEE